MYRNKEGYPDPTQGDALNGVRREERQQALEHKHNLKRGQKITITRRERRNGHGTNYVLRKTEYTVEELYPYCVLLVDSKGFRFCPSYQQLKMLMRGDYDA